MARLVEQIQHFPFVFPIDVLVHSRQKGEEARDRRRQLAQLSQLPDGHSIGLETRGNVACDALLQGTEAGELTERLKKNLLDPKYYDANTRCWASDQIIVDTIAPNRETAFWIDTEGIATITHGVVVMPYVADCFGVLVRSNFGIITARHRSLSERYSDEDIRKALEPHLETYNGNRATQVTVALVGSEGVEDTISRLKESFPSMRNSRIALPSLISQPHQVQRMVRDVSKGSMQLNTKGSIIQLATAGGVSSAAHYLIASTDERESAIYHVKHIFK